MILTNIHDTWATKIEFDNPLDFFKQPKGFWRDLIYERKLLIFKKMNWSKEDYAKFSLQFGKPWSNIDYIYSEERIENVITDAGVVTLSPFSNTLSKRLNIIPMSYHADIPHGNINSFPFRSLWITKNPNPKVSGITGFLNISEDAFSYLTKEQTELLTKVKIIQQSWYNPGTDFREFDFIKVHPITGKSSLRLNDFCKDKYQSAWIKFVKINNELHNCQLIENFINHLLQFQELQYFHTWDTFDILIYDNYQFIHNRSALIFEPGEVRHFYRMNIDHVTGL